MGLRKAGVDGDRFGEEGFCFCFLVGVAQITSAQEEIISGPALGRLALRADGAGRHHSALQRGDDGGDQLVLDCENVGQIPVISLLNPILERRDGRVFLWVASPTLSVLCRDSRV
jgi:hypothetical protein